MSKVVYWMTVSLDGFVEAPGHNIDWTAPDDELHQFANDEARTLGAFLHGRRMYELMSGYWPTADADPSASKIVVDFAHIWREKPKIVFSRTLREVAWNSRLAGPDIAAEVRDLKKSVKGDLGVGGAGIAASFLQLGLIDEFLLIVHPIVLGAGTPYFPPLEQRIPLQLIATRAFNHGVTMLRYARKE
jgi:dihydrofolate reductase